MTETRAPALPATIPGPARPPTARDGFARLVPDPLRCAADGVIAVPITLGILSTRHSGTTESGGTIVEHTWWETAVVAVAAAWSWWWILRWAAAEGRRLRPHLGFVFLVPLAGLLVALLGFTFVRSTRATPRLGPAVEAGRARLCFVHGGHRGPGIAIEVPSASWHRAAKRFIDVPFHEFAQIVRVEGGARSGIVTAPDGAVLVVFENGRCVLAFDLSADGVPSARTLQELSPFLLFDDDDVGLQGDIDELETTLARRKSMPRIADRNSNGVSPSDALLAKALGHPNAWVRAAAARLIRAGGPVLYPQATKLL